jgi:integrase
MRHSNQIDLVHHNSADRIRRHTVRKRRTRVFTHTELRSLWQWCEKSGSLTQRKARTVIRLAILLCQHRNQIAAARWDELIGLGTSHPAWRIPHARNKNKDDLQLVPLPPLAEKLFAEAAQASKESAFVFPSSTRRGVSLHPDTVTGELSIVRNALNIAPSGRGEEIALHGLCHMFKTENKGLIDSAEVRCRIQNQRSKSATSDTNERYDHADNYEADRASLEAWEKRLTEIVYACTPS